MGVLEAGREESIREFRFVTASDAGKLAAIVSALDDGGRRAPAFEGATALRAAASSDASTSGAVPLFRSASRSGTFSAVARATAASSAAAGRNPPAATRRASTVSVGLRGMSGAALYVRVLRSRLLDESQRAGGGSKLKRGRVAPEELGAAAFVGAEVEADRLAEVMAAELAA